MIRMRVLVLAQTKHGRPRATVSSKLVLTGRSRAARLFGRLKGVATGGLRGLLRRPRRRRWWS